MILLIISGILLSLICIGLYWYHKNIRMASRALLYNTADTYSDLGSEVKFEKSKNKKVWIGQSGLGNIIKEQKKELLREQYIAYSSAMKIAKNWCNLNNMMDIQNERKMADELPCIGHRQFSKFYHPMFDEKYGSQRITKKKVDSKRLLLYHYDSNQLPALVNAGSRIFDTCNDEQYRAFRLILETLEHAYIVRTYEINQSKDKRHIFLIRDLEKKGSLRDAIHCCELSTPYNEKYNVPGRALATHKIRKYGRQILEAMNYISRCGLVHYHLHSGNVILQNDNAKVSEIENVFFGYQLRHPLHQLSLC